MSPILNSGKYSWPLCFTRPCNLNGKILENIRKFTLKGIQKNVQWEPHSTFIKIHVLAEDKNIDCVVQTV